jgi:hypothetical protein
MDTHLMKSNRLPNLVSNPSHWIRHLGQKMRVVVVVVVVVEVVVVVVVVMVVWVVVVMVVA